MLNVVCLMGRICNDLELHTTPQGTEVCSFTIAVDRNYMPKGQERQTDFINVVAWRQTASFCTKYFHKGSLIAVNGSIQTRKYTDKNGNNRTAFEVVADNVHFAGSKNEQQNHAPAGGDYFEVLDDDLNDLPF